MDLGITYHAIAEHTAIIDGFADRVEYAWRDHWMLVGINAIFRLSLTHCNHRLGFNVCCDLIKKWDCLTHN